MNDEWKWDRKAHELFNMVITIRQGQKNKFQGNNQ
jgi:hypothetical protein